MTVLYRKGEDIYADEEERVRKESSPGSVAISTGQFGAILALLPRDYCQGFIDLGSLGAECSGVSGRFLLLDSAPYHKALNRPVEVRVPP